MNPELANRIQTYLETRGIAYRLHAHSPTETLAEAAERSQLGLQCLVRAVLLSDARGLVLAVLPANHLLDFHAIRECLGRDLQPVDRPVAASTFADCESGSVPPIGAPYGLTTLVHTAVFAQPTVCFEPGLHDRLVCMTGEAFTELHRDSQRAEIARPLSVLESRDVREFTLPGQWERMPALQGLHPVDDIRERITAIDRLPAMPAMARRLLRLRNDPAADVQDLVEVVSGDPSLTAQILRYARTGFFNYAGRVDTLDQAITRVLGFETVLNMALGLAASKTFRNPADGPLGLQAFWRHAAYGAALAQGIASRHGHGLDLKPGVAYLAGLLHNFGFLLLGHLYRSEFFLLNKVVAANPHIPVVLIERRLIGASHTELGARLMQEWAMPEPVVTALREHHNEMYSGAHDAYAGLVYLVDWLLRREGLGDGAEGEPPTAVLTRLGLELEQLDELVEACLHERQGLDAMARQLAA
ncbi:MAG: hypothetical protein CMN57_03630 [Gammaproteobacteria bacterium]|nr:hypothetical protein [Gammaproteobacteria bacterium]